MVASVVWMFRNRLKGEKHERTSLVDGLALLKRPRFGYGAACIFLYVGAEVAIGSNVRTGCAVENGEEAVLGTVMMLVGENSRIISKRVEEKLAELSVPGESGGNERPPHY